MKAYHTRKLTALLLAAMIIIASIAQFVSAEETVYYTETGFPKLDDVRGQLDADEIVAAGDVEINMGDIFNPTEVSCFKVESTGADADKVNISIFSARATDGTVFTSNLPGSYFAYYVVSPVSGHPAYEICRRITVNVVEQPAAPEVVETAEPVPEDAPAEDDSEDDPYEEPQADDSQAAAPVGEGEPEPEPEVAEELPEVYVDSPEAVPGDEPSDWPEEPANIPDITDDTFTEEYSDDEGFGEDMTADDPSTEYPTGDSIPSPESGILSDSAPENPASNMPQVHDEPIQTGEDTPAIPEEPSADENTPEPGGELPVPEDAAEDGDTPGESPETDGAVPEDDNPDNVETEDGEWETSMPADEPAEIDAPVISAARSLRDDAAKGRITVYKEGEMLTGYQDGQFIYTLCRLPGASFDVIAAEDIYTADHQTDEDGNRYVEYGEGTVVAKLTTDEYGEASTGELPLGSYSIVERQAPNGFVLNGNTYTVALEYAGQEVEVVTEIQTVGDERQKVDIVVEKKALGKDILLPGAEFALYAGEDILCNGAVLVPAGTHLASAITDETGVAHFDIDLPLGKYLANELRAPDGYVKSDEVIELDASYQGQELARITIPGTIENAPTRVAISKADATTDVELDGAQLTLLDSEGNEIETWTSVASEPHIIECLKIGETYTLREDIAPYGYLISNSVKFTVGDTAVLQKAVMKDDVPTGTIIINKKGEFLGAVSAMDNVGGWIENVFSFFKGNLPDVTFAVYAAEDIRHADGVTEDYYKAEDFIANITTDKTGIAVLEGLPLGKYVVREVETVDGYVLSDEEHFISLCYRDSRTPYVTFSEEWQNDRMKVRVKVTKASEGESTLLEGACFGLFNEEDITTDTGKVLLKADSLIQQRATDSSGCLVFDADLPTDFSYYIQEIVPPAGYASDPEVQRFFFERVPYIDEATIYREFSFVDKPTVVEVTKSSLTTGEELEGASLQVTDGDGKVIDNWISEKEPHVITGLVVGKTYTLTETLPVEGYTTAESIAFTIADTGDVQPIEMKDDVTKVEISKTDITGKKELPDAKLTILDSEGEVVETWTSTDEPHYIEMLPIGKYTLREETAPKGYLVAEDVEFEVTDTAEIQRCVMKDAEENPDKPGTPKTGDTRNPVLWVGVSVVALLGLMTAVLVMRKNRRKF